MPGHWYTVNKCGGHVYFLHQRTHNGTRMCQYPLTVFDFISDSTIMKHFIIKYNIKTYTLKFMNQHTFVPQRLSLNQTIHNQLRLTGNWYVYIKHTTKLKVIYNNNRIRMAGTK